MELFFILSVRERGGKGERERERKGGEEQER